MNTIAVRNEHDRKKAILALQHRNVPFTVTMTAGAPRSIEQNRLQRLWLKEAAEQGDQTAEEYRAYCKLHGGVPILRSENESFRVQYDSIIRPLSYEQKLEIMKVPIDLPVTRLMTSRQKKQYLDWMFCTFSEMGFKLSDPDELKWGRSEAA